MTSGTWTSFHRRGDVLRAVVAAADTRLDGALPLDVDGVRETFDDELDLLGALGLRWHTRLAGRIERELAAHPADAEEAVLAAWRSTAAELPGVRAVLDRHRDAPLDAAMERAVATSTAKEHTLLAVLAGRAVAHDTTAPRLGRALEERARSGLAPVPAPRAPRAHAAAGAPGLLERLRAALAA